METSDREVILLKRLRKGSKDAFETMFRLYYAPLCVHASHYVGDQDAENIVQDLMAHLWENRRRLEINTSLRAYLYKAVRNRALTLLARSKTRGKVLENIGRSMDFYFLPPSCPFDELMAMFDKAMQKLPEEVREAFIQSRFEGKTYKEIAAEANVSVKIIDHRIQKAVTHLRRQMAFLQPNLA